MMSIFAGDGALDWMRRGLAWRSARRCARGRAWLGDVEAWPDTRGSSMPVQSFDKFSSVSEPRIGRMTIVRTLQENSVSWTPRNQTPEDQACEIEGALDLEDTLNAIRGDDDSTTPFRRIPFQRMMTRAWQRDQRVNVEFC